MNTPCLSLRERLLGLPDESTWGAGDRQHVERCRECRDWLERAEVAAEAVRSLPRCEAPIALVARVEAEMERMGTEHRLEGAFAELTRQRAPSLLQDLVFDPAQADASPLARTLMGLHRHRAPAVLERLVDEELGEPAAQRARRFVGDLERIAVPDELTGRMRQVEAREEPRRRILFPIAALAAAAALALWVGLLRGEPKEYRFEVVRVHSVHELSPLARHFAEGLSGGVLAASRSLEAGR